MKFISEILNRRTIWWKWYIRKINLVADPVDLEEKDDLLLQNKKWLSNSQKPVKGHLDRRILSVLFPLLLLITFEGH